MKEAEDFVRPECKELCDVDPDFTLFVPKV
jgi:hypothetical protein